MHGSPAQTIKVVLLGEGEPFSSLDLALEDISILTIWWPWNARQGWQNLVGREVHTQQLQRLPGCHCPGSLLHESCPRPGSRGKDAVDCVLLSRACIPGLSLLCNFAAD